MIPTMNIIAWGGRAPWAERRQIEQDLVISRAIVELFADEFLRTQLRFRGGTALNKLHFPAPMRYSEDIDLVRTTHDPIKPILGRVREILQPWLGEAAFDQSPVSPKLIFRVPAEDGSAPLRLKIEINTRETEACDAPPPAAADALTDEAARKAFSDVFTGFVIQLPGEPWARTAEMRERFGLVLYGT